jgi:hypothetical protein
MTHEQIKSLFDSEQGWTTQFEINGVKYGGNTPVLANDPRLLWHIKEAGGVKGKRILELGPLECGHTKTMLEHGAGHIIAIEGNTDCYRRCRIVADVFNFSVFQHDIRQADFVESVKCLGAEGKLFDVVSASGVLYHQLNPAMLIYDIARIADTVFVWSHVASDKAPNGDQTEIFGDEHRRYKGRFNHYGDMKSRQKNYCAGLNDKAVWMYPDEMLRCFDDAGFKDVKVKEQGAHQNGDFILFIAKK